jgi:hypothetical protein
MHKALWLALQRVREPSAMGGPSEDGAPTADPPNAAMPLTAHAES